MPEIVENGDRIFKDAMWKALTGALLALVMFLSGWVWNMERRVTTLEATRPMLLQNLAEIKMDVKEIRDLILDEARRSPRQ